MAGADGQSLTLPFVRGSEVLVSLSNADADLIGYFVDASLAGVALESVRTYNGTKVGENVFVPWSSMVYIKRFERQRAE